MKRQYLLMTLFLLISVQFAPAQIPQTVSYQGVLTDAEGNAVADGEFSLTFKLYDAATGGTELWQETQSVTVVNGVFNAILGSITPLDLPFNEKYFLGISVANDPELSPRIELAASAYSLTARSVMGTSNIFPSEGKVGIGTITPIGKLEIADDSFSFIKIRNTAAGGSILDLLAGGRFNNSISVTNAGGAPALNFSFNGTTRMTITGDGNVGIGTTSPNNPLEMGSGAHVTAGGVWTDASSRKYKENIRGLTVEEAMTALGQLQPMRFNYKVDKQEDHVGFIAEDVPDIVATNDRKSLSPMDIVGVLTKVVQEQRKAISKLQNEVNVLKQQIK